MGFSEQYFYSTILIGGGITFLVWGTCTMYYNGYNPFDDKFTLLYMLIYSFLFTICMYVVRAIENSIRIWQKPK